MDIHHVELAHLAARDRFRWLAFSALPDAPIQPVRRTRRRRPLSRM